MLYSLKLQYVKALEDKNIRQEIKILCKRSNLINWATIATILALYIGGITLIMLSEPYIALLGVIPLTVSMILSWYLSHDCAHLLVFRGRKYNDLLGDLLAWINGLLYFNFHEYRKDHLRHHLEQVDLIGVGVDKLLSMLPRPFGKLSLFLERCYIPVIHFIIKIYNIRSVIQSKNTTSICRATLVSVASISFLVLLTLIHWWALLLYFFAVIIRIHCVRLVDAFQHSYLQIDPSNKMKPQNKLFEQQNTFSYPVARRFKFFNFIILNFGFHNAHHAITGCPWYNLPKLDEIIAGYNTSPQDASNLKNKDSSINFFSLIYHYHKKLTHRITSTDEGHPYDEEFKFSMKDFTGAFTDNLLG